MKTMSTDAFDPSTVVAELLDGSGALRLPQLFTEAQVKAARDIIHRTDSFPTRINASFPLNAQATIVIDPFTRESGATAFRPGSQKALHYPGAADDFFQDYEQMVGDPGDVILFFGAAWHCAMPNNSEQGRIGILIEYLPKFVKPVEDMLGGLDQQFLDAASPLLRQLLGFAYPWPSTPSHPPLE